MTDRETEFAEFQAFMDSLPNDEDHEWYCTDREVANSVLSWFWWWKHTAGKPSSFDTNTAPSDVFDLKDTRAPAPVGYWPVLRIENPEVLPRGFTEQQRAEIRDFQGLVK